LFSCQLYFPAKICIREHPGAASMGTPSKKHGQKKKKKKKKHISSINVPPPLSPRNSSHTTLSIQTTMPAVTPNTRKAKGGRKAGAQNFSVSDKEFLVTLLEEIRPLGQEQWDEVVSRYNSEWAEPSERNTRDRDALRGQWYKMLRERKPTGDPSCPDHVRRAKRLNR
jgi:hypothetical protein